MEQNLSKCLDFLEEELKEGVTITPSVMESLRTVAEGMLYERLYAIRFIKRQYEKKKLEYEDALKEKE